MWIFQAVGYDADYKTPHIPGPSPVLANLTYPYSPHDAPHEFLIFKKSVPYPTAVTPWSNEVPQAELFKIPPAYN